MRRAILVVTSPRNVKNVAQGAPCTSKWDCMAAHERYARLHRQRQCATMGLCKGREARGTDAVRRLNQLVHQPAGVGAGVARRLIVLGSGVVGVPIILGLTLGRPPWRPRRRHNALNADA